MDRAFRLTIALAALVAATACAWSDGKLDRPPPAPARAVTAPARLCTSPARSRACRSPLEVERWLRQPDLRILRSDRPPAGKQAVHVLTLVVPGEGGQGEVVFRAKFRRYTWPMNWQITPRHEIGAYAVQKLFLAPHEYVIPPTAGHCFPLEHYRAQVERAAQPTFARTRCVFGVLSYWLEDVQTMADAERAGWLDWEQDMVDEDLFDDNPFYRRWLGNLNLVTFLIEHADSHWKQFVIGKNPRRPVIYSVDNNMSFGARRNPNLALHWADIQVPVLPRDKVDALIEIDPASLERLRVIEQYRVVDGQLVSVTPERPPGATNAGMWRHGDQFKLGLTAGEVQRLRGRLRTLATLTHTRTFALE